MAQLSNSKQNEKYADLLMREAVELFTNQTIQSKVPKMSSSESLSYLSALLTSVPVHSIFCKYTIYILNLIKDNTVLFAEFLSSDYNQCVLLFLQTYFQHHFNSLHPLNQIFTSQVQKSENLTQNFHQNLESLMSDFESQKMILMQNINKLKNQLFEVNCENVIDKMDLMLFLEGFVFVVGDEFSGKTTLVKNYIGSLGSDFNSFFVISVDKTTDFHSLLGNYVIKTSEEDPKFEWKDGCFVASAKRGHLCVLENFELASDQLKSFISEVIIAKKVRVGNREVFFHQDFRLIVVSREEDSKHDRQTVRLQPVGLRDLIASKLSNSPLNSQLRSVVVNLCLTSSRHRECASMLKMFTLLNRLTSLFQIVPNTSNCFISSEMIVQTLLTFVEVIFENNMSLFLSHEIFNEICQVFNTHSGLLTPALTGYSSPLKIEKSRLSSFRYSIELSSVSRKAKELNSKNAFSDQFVLTRKTAVLVDSIMTCVVSNENVLLVGETGCGKTTVVQELSRLFGKRLNVFNLSHNTDAFDLFGGFKPLNEEVTFRHDIVELEGILKGLYSLEKNAIFLEGLENALRNKLFGVLAKALVQSASKIQKDLQLKRKSLVDKADQSELNEVEITLEKTDSLIQRNTAFLKNRKSKSTHLSLEFVKGVILRSIEQDEWLLLDEINLATEEVLFRLHQLLFDDKVFVAEAADSNFIRKHKNFRLFACMNPAFEVGKKPLPKRIKEGFTTLHVSAISELHEVLEIVDDFFKRHTMVNTVNKRKLAEFYVELRRKTESGEMLDKNNKKIVFTMRQLRRACNITKECLANNQVFMSPVNSIYVGMRLSFSLDLNESSKKHFNLLFNGSFGVQKIEEVYLENSFFKLQNDFDKSNQMILWEGFPVRKMNKIQSVERIQSVEKSQSVEGTNSGSSDIIITPNIRTIVCDLLRVIMYDGSRPILLEGPTSVGKTSIVVHLARIMGQKIVRLNNHRDTDVDEYVGSYVPSQSGKIRFQEGVLLQCMREGSWLLLDELNLAKSEILEALNRVLDDNQELFVPELDAMVKPEPGFRIFATQNPNSYSGRSVLSTAFRNRFIVVNFENHDENDLKQILVSKSQLPESRAKVMIGIMRKLQNMRTAERVFEGKESLITIRDLMKWGNRKDDFSSMDQLARSGYFLLGERIRDHDQKVNVRNVISEETNIVFESDSQLYQLEFDSLVRKTPKLHEVVGAFKIELSSQFKRLFCLTNHAVTNRESVLLIGPPGCGKTTLAQMLAEVYQVPFYSINCHKHTEVSDFLGTWKPLRNREGLVKELREKMSSLAIQVSEESQDNPAQMSRLLEENKSRLSLEEFNELSAKLTRCQSEFEWIEGSLVEAVKSGGIYLIDEISLASDSVLERLNSLLESTRQISLQQSDQRFETITAHPKFVIIATMNPSGDYGKRELSPALRNRFTEIWVTSILDSENFQPGYFAEIKSFLSSIIDALCVKNVENKEEFQKTSQISKELIFQIFNFINGNNRHFLKNLNLRDLSTLCHIFSKNFDSCGMKSLVMACYMTFENISSQISDVDLYWKIKHDFDAIVHHSLGFAFNFDELKEFDVQLNNEFLKFGFVKIERKLSSERSNDRVNSMNTISNKSSKDKNQNAKKEENQCGHLGSLKNQQREMQEDEWADKEMPFETDWSVLQQEKMQFESRDSSDCSKNKKDWVSHVSFLEKTEYSDYLLTDEEVKFNTFRILFGLQSDKPILIEGNSGCGKSSLINVIGLLTGNPVLRIGLTEQTDLIDLLGSFVPDQKNVGSFVWRDGPLLKALKEGYWIVFDELNLANQTILEGLNSILDHRGEVFLPDLGQTVCKQKGFRFFGTQNPTGTSKNRKGLPASFLNRFFKIKFKDFSNASLKNIVLHLLNKKTENKFLFVEVTNVLLKYAENNPKLDIRFFMKVIGFLKNFAIENENAYFVLSLIDSIYLRGQFGISSINRISENKTSYFQKSNDEESRNVFSYVCIEYAVSKNGPKNQSNLIRNSREINCSPAYSLTAYSNFDPRTNISIPLSGALLNVHSYPVNELGGLLFSLLSSIHLNHPVILLNSNDAHLQLSTSLIDYITKSIGVKSQTISLFKSADVSDIIGNYEQANWETAVKFLVKSIKKSTFVGLIDFSKFKLFENFDLFFENFKIKERDTLKEHVIKELKSVLDLFKNHKEENSGTSGMMLENRHPDSNPIKSDRISSDHTDRNQMGNLRLDTGYTDSPQSKFDSDFEVKQTIHWRKELEDLILRVEKVMKIVETEKSIFIWKNSRIIKALMKGHFLVLRNCEEINQGVIEKLNEFLEQKEFLLNDCFDENGNIMKINKHTNTRFFLLFNGTKSISRGIQSRCLTIDLEHYLKSENHPEELTFKKHCRLTKSISNFHYFPETWTNRFLHLEFMNAQNFNVLLNTLIQLQGNRSVSPIDFPQLNEKQSDVIPLTEWTELLSLNTKSFLRSLCLRHLKVEEDNNVFGCHFWAENELMKSLTFYLNENLPQTEWADFPWNANDVRPVWNVLQMVKNKHNFDSESIVRMIEFSDYEALLRTMVETQNAVNLKDLSISDSGKVGLSEGEKILNLILLKSKETKNRLYCPLHRNSGLYQLMTDESFKAKEDFANMISPVKEENFIKIIRSVLRDAKEKSNKNLKAVILGQQDCHSDSLKIIDEITQPYVESVNEFFEKTCSDFNDSLFSLFDEFEESHILLLPLSENVLHVVPNLFFLKSTLHLTKFNNHSDMLFNNYPSLTMLSDSFSSVHALIQKITCLKRTSKLNYLHGPLHHQIIETVKGILNRKNELENLKFSLNEQILAINYLQKIQNNFRLKNFERNSKNFDLSFFEKKISEKINFKQSMKFFDKNLFISSIKRILQFEHQIFKIEEVNFFKNFENFHQKKDCFDMKKHLNDFLNVFVELLNHQFRNQIYLGSSFSKENTESQLMIGEKIYNLTVDRVLSLESINENRLFERLKENIPKTLEKVNPNTIFTLSELIIELFESTEWIFNPVVDEKFILEICRLFNQVRYRSVFLIPDYYSEKLPENHSLVSIQLRLFESKYSFKKVKELSLLLHTQSIHWYDQLQETISQMNVAYNRQIKNSGLGDAAKLIRLNEHLDKVAKYEYEKETVEENKQEKEDEFRSMFGLDTHGRDNQNNQNNPKLETKKLEKMTNEFHSNFKRFWNNVLLNLSIEENIRVNFKGEIKEYVDLIREVSVDDCSPESLSEIMSNLFKSISDPSVSSGFLNQTEIELGKNSTFFKRVVFDFWKSKNQLENKVNFYETAPSNTYAERLTRQFNLLLTNLLRFYRDPSFRDFPTFNVLLKSIKSISEMKADSSFSTICTAIEMLIKGLDEFSACLPEPLKLTNDRENLRKLLLEMRRQEKHKWKDFVEIKKHHLMDEDIVAFSNQIGFLQRDEISIVLPLINSVLENSSLISYSQRIILLTWKIKNMKNASTRKVLMNVIEYFSSFSFDVTDKIESLKTEIEEPMKNSMKLMNWHFEDILNLKINVEKLYKGIHKTVKRQKECLEVPMRETVLLPLRNSLFFGSIAEAYANISKVVYQNLNVDKKEQTISKAAFMESVGKSPSGGEFFKEKDLSFFKLISPSKIISLFGGTVANTKPIFKSNLLFKNELKVFTKNYLLRMKTLQEEKNRTFVQRTINDLLIDLKTMGLKNRLDYKSPVMLQKLFDNFQSISNVELPMGVNRIYPKNQVNEKIDKMNKRFARIVDILKCIVEGCPLSDDLSPDLREKLLAVIFDLYFILAEHTQKVIKIMKTTDENQVENPHLELIQKAVFIIDTNIELSKTEHHLETETSRILNEVKTCLLSQRANDGLQLLTTSESSNEVVNVVRRLLGEYEQSTAQQDHDGPTKDECLMTNCEDISKEILKNRNLLLHQISKIKSTYPSKSSNIFLMQLKILTSIKGAMTSMSSISSSQKSTYFTDKNTNQPFVKQSVDLTFSVLMTHSLQWLYELNKSVYLIALIASNVVQKGFCIPDVDDKNQPNRTKEEKFGGTGMGEGQGDQNVTNEMEFEEQLLGLKGDQKNDKDDEIGEKELGEKEEEMEMEMENDFGGTDRKKKGEEDEEEEDKDDKDDQFESVDERKSDVELFQDEQENEEEGQDHTRKDQGLQLETHSLRNEDEKLKPKEDKNAEIRDLDKDGVRNQDNDQEAEDAENENQNSDLEREVFDQSLPDKMDDDLNSNESGGMEIEENQSVKSSMGDEGEDGQEEIIEEEVSHGDAEEENIEEEEHSKGEDELNPKDEERQSVESEEDGRLEDDQYVQMKEEGKLGAQELKNDQEGFGSSEVTQNKSGGGGVRNNQTKFEEDKKTQMREKLKNAFEQKVRVNQSSIDKILKDVHINPQEQELESLEPVEQMEYQLDDREENRIHGAGQGKGNSEGIDKEMPEEKSKEYENKRPLMNNDALHPSKFEENLLLKRDHIDMEQHQESLKKVKMNESHSSEAIFEYSAIQKSELENQQPTSEYLKEDKLAWMAEKTKLCEELKSILELKKTNDLKGDFRSGKRLNMKRVISYIASNYRKDKIWLRRTDPSQQDYRILVAVDDSSSMRSLNQRKQRRENGLGRSVGAGRSNIDGQRGRLVHRLHHSRNEPPPLQNGRQ